MKALAARERELIEFARELVAIPSPAPPGDERKVAERAQHEMKRLGYEGIQTIALEPERPNLVGEIGGGGQVLMLNGHVDTKPPGDLSEWETGPFDPVIREGRLYGLGSADMKGAVAAMVYAGGAIAETGGPPNGTLRIVLTADEEAGSRFGARFLAGRPELAADAVLVGEATGMQTPWSYIAVASRGIACFRVSVRGTQMHSSLSDQVPSVNASVKLAQVLARMAADFKPQYPRDPAVPGGPTVNLGVTMSGGVYFGIYPGHAEFGMDIRTVPGMTQPGLLADLTSFVQKLQREDPELDVSVEPVPDLDWLPPSSIDPGHPLVAATQSAAQDVLQREVPLKTMPAFTDGSYWSLAGAACIPALGPGTLLVAHRPNENVAVDELTQAARIYALTALRYLGEGA